MSVQIIDCEQGSPEWRLARLGIPTASEFSTVMAKGRGGGDSVTRRKYMLTLIGERLTGEIAAEGYTNVHMERGKVMEQEARDAYAFLKDIEPRQVGFIRNEIAGASPDSLIGDTGLLEIKTKLPHLHLDVLYENRLPPEHVAQVQGQLWVSGREWLDFVSYWPKLRPFVIRVHRDEEYIAKLKIAVEDFSAELLNLMEKLK